MKILAGLLLFTLSASTCGFEVPAEFFGPASPPPKTTGKPTGRPPPKLPVSGPIVGNRLSYILPVDLLKRTDGKRYVNVSTSLE